MATACDADAVRAQLERMRTSSVFARAGRMYPLLEYLVEAELAGNGRELNQYRIATEVLGRDAQFDAASDSIVRVEIGRLRNKLREFYESEGSGDATRIALPKGSYRPSIKVAGTPFETGSDLSEQQSARELAFPRPTAADRLGSALVLPAAARAASWRIGAPRFVLAALLLLILVGPIGTGVVRETQDGIAARVAREVRAELAAADAPDPQPAWVSLPREPTTSPEAYDVFLRLPTVSPRERIELLDHVLEIDPGFAEAHAMKAYLLSQALINSPWGPAFAVPADELGKLIERHSRQAVEHDPDTPLAEIATGCLYLFTWRWSEAERAFAQAAATSPNEGRLLNRAYLAAFSGRHDDAVALMDRLVTHNPGLSALLSIRGLFLAMGGDLDAAAESLASAASAMPLNEGQRQSMLIERSWLATVEVARGRSDAAVRELRFLEEFSVETRDAELPFIVYVYSRLGRDADVSRLLAELELTTAADGPFGMGAKALMSLASGDEDSALDWLEAAASRAANHEPDPNFFALMILRENLLADPVLRRPEFVEVLSRIAGS